MTVSSRTRAHMPESSRTRAHPSWAPTKWLLPESSRTRAHPSWASRSTAVPLLSSGNQPSSTHCPWIASLFWTKQLDTCWCLKSTRCAQRFHVVPPDLNRTSHGNVPEILFGISSSPVCLWLLAECSVHGSGPCRAESSFDGKPMTCTPTEMPSARWMRLPVEICQHLQWVWNFTSG